jgi:phosphoglycolate phosphatase
VLTRCAIQRAGEVLGHELDPGRVLVVGDTPRDVQAAHDVGAKALAVAAYHHTREQLEASGAEYVLDSLEEPIPGLE